MPRRELALVSLLFATAGLVCLFFYLRVRDGVEKKKKERDPFITAPLNDQWMIFPSAKYGMDEIVEEPIVAPSIGAVPPIDGSVPALYEDGMFDEVIESSHDRTVGLFRYPDVDTAMCYASYTDTGDIQWMVHRSAFGGLSSAGMFSEGVPEDGLFLLDLNTGKIVVQLDIYNYYRGRDLLPDLGLVELIHGKVVGMASLKTGESDKLIDQYLATKPQIRKCLEK